MALGREKLDACILWVPKIYPGLIAVAMLKFPKKKLEEYAKEVLLMNVKVTLIASDVALETCQSNPSWIINFFQIFNNERKEKSPNIQKCLCSLYHNSYLATMTKFLVDK